MVKKNQKEKKKFLLKARGREIKVSEGNHFSNQSGNVATIIIGSQNLTVDALALVV